MEGKGKFFIFIDTFSDLVILGLLWTFCSLPIVTIGASSSALYYSVARTIRYGEGKPVQVFFRNFRTNIKSTIIPTMLYEAVLIPLLLITVKNGAENKLLALLCLCLLTQQGIYLFPLMSRFSLTAVQYFQVSLSFIFGHFGKTMCLFGVFILCVVCVYFLPFTFVILIGTYCFYSTFYLEKIFKEYYSEKDLKNEEAWYLKI